MNLKLCGHNYVVLITSTPLRLTSQFKNKKCVYTFEYCQSSEAFVEQPPLGFWWPKHRCVALILHVHGGDGHSPIESYGDLCGEWYLLVTKMKNIPTAPPMSIYEKHQLI